MYRKGLTGFIYTFSDWFFRIAYLNILWIFFSLLGLVVFGFFPATIALFSVIRLLLISDEDIPIFKTFRESLKKEFLKGNAVGWGISIFLMISYFNIQFFKAVENDFLQLFYYPMIILVIIFGMTMFYFIPTYVHYDMKLLQILKNSFLIMIYNPLNTLTMTCSIFVFGFVSLTIPSIIPFISASLTALFIMMAALKSFKRIEEKKFYRLNLDARG